MTMKEIESNNSVFFRNPEVKAYYVYSPEQKTLTYHYYADPAETWLAHRYFGDPEEKKRLLNKELATIVYYDIDTQEEATQLLHKIGELCCGDTTPEYTGKVATELITDLDNHYRLCRLRKGDIADLRLHSIKTKLIVAKSTKNSNYIIIEQEGKIKSYRFTLQDNHELLSAFLTSAVLLRMQHIFTYKQWPILCDSLQLRTTAISIDYAYGDAFRCNADHTLYTEGVPIQLEINPLTNAVYYRTDYNKDKLFDCGSEYQDQLRLYARFLQPENGETVTLVKRLIKLRIDGIQNVYTAYYNKEAETPINLCDGTQINPKHRLIVLPQQENAVYKEGARLLRKMAVPLTGTYDDFLKILAKCMGWQLTIEDAS